MPALRSQVALVAIATIIVAVTGHLLESVTIEATFVWKEQLATWQKCYRIHMPVVSGTHRTSTRTHRTRTTTCSKLYSYYCHKPLRRVIGVSPVGIRVSFLLVLSRGRKIKPLTLLVLVVCTRVALKSPESRHHGGMPFRMN